MISVRWGTTPQLNIFYKSAIDRKLDVVRHNYRFCLPRTNLMHVTQCMSRPFQCDLYNNIQQLLSTQYFQWDDQTCLRSSPGNSRGEPGADRWSWNEALRLTKAQVHTSTQVHTSEHTQSCSQNQGWRAFWTLHLRSTDRPTFIFIVRVIFRCNVSGLHLISHHNRNQFTLVVSLLCVLSSYFCKVVIFAVGRVLCWWIRADGSSD